MRFSFISKSVRHHGSIITSTHRRQDLKPFRHLSSCDRPVVRVLPMSRCCWKHGGETSSISRSISAKAVFSELAWSNWWKETKLAWEFYHVQFIHHFRVMFMSFFFIFMFSFFFLVAHQSDPHLQSHHAVSWRNHSPLALRKWHLQPISQTAKLAFRLFFLCFFFAFRTFSHHFNGFSFFFALFDTFSENAR